MAQYGRMALQFVSDPTMLTPDCLIAKGGGRILRKRIRGFKARMTSRNGANDPVTEYISESDLSRLGEIRKNRSSKLKRRKSKRRR